MSLQDIQSQGATVNQHHLNQGKTQFQVDFEAAAAFANNEFSESYFLDHSAVQNVRLNLQHHLVRQRFDGHNYKGIPRDLLELGASVLDVGCGSGIWLAEMQRDFPEGDYVGLDIKITEWASTFQQLSGEKIRLVEADVLQKLPFDDESFDYVHQQNMFGAVPAARWPDVIAEFFRVTKPGGYIDLVEIEIPGFPNDPPTQNLTEVIKVISSIFAARGINSYLGRELRSLVESSHLYEEIETIERLAPLGWTLPGEGEEIGRLWAWDVRRLYEAIGGLATQALGKTVDEWNAIADGFILELAEVKAGLPIYRVFARRRL
ncbi:S-adenosyl-L-methionine-dependent methyltransferase [Cladochytrium replicatum]|nr:S-adenosyl-L-methionine-dependent methyltransferase [Cladochytrium replicatum]